MPRLNQSRRQKIGYVYCPQVDNNIALPPNMRNMAVVQEQSFEQNMTGQGVQDIIRGIMNNRKQILKMGSKAVDIASSDVAKQVGKIVFDNLPSDKQDKIKRLHDRVKPVNNAIQRRQDIADMVKTGTKMYKDIRGNGLNPAGGSRGSIPTSVGSGLSPAGGAIDIRGNQEGDMLPGDMLRKKLLQKMIRERRMRSLGDRVKTAPIKHGFNGGSLVIPTINNKMGSQSMSKTLPSTKPYKLNPRPLVGAGVGNIPVMKIIRHLQKTVIPALKSEGLVARDLTNTAKIKKLIAMRAKKIIQQGLKDPEKIIMKVVETLKPIMKGKGLGLAGAGWKDTLGRVSAKILAGMFRMGNPDSVIAKGFDKLGNYNPKGGFIIAGLIALGSAIAAAASTAAATTVIGSVTVGTLAGAALTGASTAAGAAIVKKIAGDGLKDIIVKTVKQTKIAYKKLSKADQDKIKNGLIKLKKNPSKAGVISFAKSIAPIALKATKKELQPKLTKVFKDAGMSGKGLKLAGQGLGLAGSGEKKFKNEFVKILVKKIS